MRLPVASDQSRPVDGKGDVQILNTDIVENLIIGPLQKRGVDTKIGLHSAGRQSGRKGYAVLFCDANVKKAVRIKLPASPP